MSEGCGGWARAGGRQLVGALGAEMGGGWWVVVVGGWCNDNQRLCVHRI